MVRLLTGGFTRCGADADGAEPLASGDADGPDTTGTNDDDGSVGFASALVTGGGVAAWRGIPSIVRLPSPFEGAAEDETGGFPEDGGWAPPGDAVGNGTADIPIIVRLGDVVAGSTPVASAPPVGTAGS